MNTLLCVMTILLLLFLLGVPIFMSLIASTIIALLISGDLSTTVIQNSLFDGLNSFLCWLFLFLWWPEPSWKRQHHQSDH